MLLGMCKMLLDQPVMFGLKSYLSSFGLYNFNSYSYNGLLWLLAAAISYAFVVFNEPGNLLRVISIALVVLLFWHLVFSKGKVFDAWSMTYLILYALLFCMLLPFDISMWMLVVSVSFGCVFGERIFGGRGYSFLHPVTVGMAFYLYSYDIEFTSNAVSYLPVWLIIGLALILIVLNLVSWRTIGGLVIGLTSLHWVLDSTALQSLLFNSTTLFILIFLASDPGSGASTNPARWLHGALCGFLFSLLYSQSGEHMLSLVFAVLLASLSSPLLDAFIVQLHISRRSRRRG